MKSQRLFNLFAAIALMAVIFLTAREAVAISELTSQVKSENHSESRCADLPPRYSIRSEFDSKREAWITVSEDGATGLDGGLIQLLSDYRTCSR